MFNLRVKKVLKSIMTLSTLFLFTWFCIDDKKGAYDETFDKQYNYEVHDGWLVVLGFNDTLIAKVISWRSVTHMCFLAFSH